MTAPPAFHAFETREAMVAALVAAVAARLGEAVSSRGAASLVVPGGSTPGPALEALSAAELAWDKVFVTLSDERWVAPGDPASNEGQLRRTLLQGRASAARFLPLKTGASSPEEGLAELEARLAEAPLPFDVVLLGMGADGHVASLFPDSPALEADTLVCAANVAGAAGAGARVSLSLPALLDSRWIALLIQGRDKMETWMDAALGGPIAEKPVRALIAGPTPLEVFWAP